LPLQQATKIEINLNNAGALGLNIPLPNLGRADEVIGQPRSSAPELARRVVSNLARPLLRR